MRTTRKKGTTGESEPEEKAAPLPPPPKVHEDARASSLPRTQPRPAPGAFPDGKTLADVMSKDEFVSPSQMETVPEVTFVNPTPHLGGHSGGPIPTEGDYRVLKEQWISCNGCRALLRKGDTISATSYDMASLIQQGVELEKV